MKKTIIVLLILLISIFSTNSIFSAKASELNFDPNVDYSAKMAEIALKGGDISIGREYELKRNAKLAWLTKPDGESVNGITILKPYIETNYFDGSMTIPEIRYNMGLSAYIYTEEDVDLLARLITAEVGCSWIPMWVKLATGSVVLNHVDSPKYSNTIRGAIYDPGVYGCVINGTIYRNAQPDCVEAARYLLNNGKTLPDYVLGQGPRQGNVYASYYDCILGTTTWFCY